MTETPDPTATFRLDQEQAKTEAETREQTTWEHQVRVGNANAMQLEANALLMMARANHWKALAHLTYAAVPMMAVATLRLLRRKR